MRNDTAALREHLLYLLRDGGRRPGCSPMERVSPPATYVDSSVHVLGAHRAGNTLEIRVDGKVSNSITSAAVGTANVSSVGYAAIIGENGYNTSQADFQQVHGDVAEMIGVKAGLGWYLQWAQGWAAYSNMYAALIVMSLLCSGAITVLFRTRDRLLVWQKGVVKW